MILRHMNKNYSKIIDNMIKNRCKILKLRIYDELYLLLIYNFILN